MKRAGRNNKKLGLILLLPLLYIAWCLLRPIPQIKPEFRIRAASLTPSSSQLSWPDSQAALAINSSNVESKGIKKPLPTASTAKIITALMILKQKPLQPGQQGPKIIISAQDVEIYRRYVAQDGSVLPVQVGETLTEYQALQALMLPSANNIADTLAIWAYGSLQSYAQAANNYLSSNKLYGTRVGSDASGLSPDSTSTASDLARLGYLAIQNPVLAEIVGQSSATGIPIVGTIKNVNILLGQYGINGVKTGNSDQAGGAYVAASIVEINHKSIPFVTALVGAKSLPDAMNQSLPLIRSAKKNISNVEVVKPGQIVGWYKVPWSQRIAAKAQTGLKLEVWNGHRTSTITQLDPLSANSAPGTLAGTLRVPSTNFNDQKSVSVIIKQSVPKPSISWRLLHPLAR